MIIAKNIHKYYGEVAVLKGVDFHIKKGEIVAIVGPSGAGKTTLLQILGTLDKPQTTEDHELFLNEISIKNFNDKEISSFRNKHIGFIFQFHQLLPEFTALENVCIPAFIGGKPKLQTEKRAKELLNFLGLSHRENHKPNELSGGEQQRVAVARALINKPSVIFADEPSGNLDSTSAENLHKLFFELRDKFGQTFVLVTHNKELAEMADRTLTMKDGVITNSENINLNNISTEFTSTNNLTSTNNKYKARKLFLGGIGALTAGFIGIFFGTNWSLITGIPLILVGLYGFIFGAKNIFFTKK
jgi:lipoprotein-releasing system ATP-binding protein